MTDFVPAHVPANLVRDVDVFNIQAVNADIHVGWKQVQDENPPIFFTPRNGGHWLATRAPMIERLFHEPENFASRHSYIPPLPAGVPEQLPICADAPEHRAYRSFITPFLVTKRLSAAIDRARVLAIELIENLYPRGECDFTADFAQHLPIQIFLDIVDLPLTDRPKLVKLAEIVRMSDNEKKAKAFGEMFHYLDDAIKQRIENPGDDMISAIVNGKIDGRPMTHAEMLGECSVVLLGGLDTVASMMGFIANFLASDPKIRHRLAESPALISGRVDELMRRFGVAAPTRRVTHDMEVDGVSLKEGDLFFLASCLHGLDDERWEGAMTVDLDRRVNNPQTFGANGPHRCPGAALARSEVIIFLEEWLKRIPDFRIKPGSKVLAGSGNTNGMLSLPLEWDVKPRQTN